MNGVLPNYRLIGTMSRTLSKAEYLANKANNFQNESFCKAYDSTTELLAQKPDYIVETASPSALRDFALDALANGSSIVPLSIGAFADEVFFEEVKKAALENKAKVYIPSGAIGGLDVMRTASLMGQCSVHFKTEKNPGAFTYSKVNDGTLLTEQKEVFRGNAKGAIALFPTMVNVAVAASLASVGPSNIDVPINSMPDYRGDKHSITVESDEVTAELNVYSRTPDIAGWSVVNTLRNISSPIVF